MEAGRSRDGNAPTRYGHRVIEVGDLGAIPLLTELDERELEMLAAGADRVDVEAGEELTREGEFGHAVFAIVAGTAEVTVDGAVVRRLGPGEVFGEIAVMASGRRTATVTATTEMRLISLFKRDLWSLADRNRGFADKLRGVTDPAGESR